MSVNADEALRAKEIAEDYLRKSDFVAARRLALRAQKLDENLENLHRMIMVCDVHCASMEKCGADKDWYKILQVEQNADENMIKKQYRKLALHLHPDKNKLPGAEAAFKTIGEAQRVLLDKEKRKLHDMKCKTSTGPTAAPSYRPRNVPAYHTQPVFQTNNNAKNPFMAPKFDNQQKPQVQPTAFRGGLSFWTSCIFCQSKYEYPREYLNRQLSCRSCNKLYIAFEVPFQGQPTQSSGQTTFSGGQQNKVPTQQAGKAAQKKPENIFSVYNQQNKAPTKEADKATQKQPKNSTRPFSRKEGSATKNVGAGAQNNNGKRKRKKIVDSSESSSESSSDSEDVSFVDSIRTGQNLGSNGGQQSRRSVRSKQQVSYKENMSDGDSDSMDPNERLAKENGDTKGETSFYRKQPHENHHSTETLRNSIKKEKKRTEDQVEGSSSKKPNLYDCPDPDFTNFDKSRDEKCFEAGQIWAVYDTPYGMPRFYACVRKVIRAPRFKLKIRWLESKPDTKTGRAWVRKRLPISVGKFEWGADQDTNDILMFSHLIRCRLSYKQDPVNVYPRIGETWALFKNWNSEWSSSQREFEFEFVEILSEYSKEKPIDVAFLSKVEGFASVYRRIPTHGSATSQIQPSQLLKFSHMIPSTKLTGKEAKGIPVGSYELDTAALLLKTEKESAPVSPKAAKSTQVNRNPFALDSDCMVIPSFEFHDFSADRLERKFEVGQIWSLKSKQDGLPKHYVKIQQIVFKPVFKLQMIRLELKSLPENVTQWSDNKMPVTCGNFKEDEVVTTTSVADFLHNMKKMKTESSRKNEYTILPRTGEIWAIYKNWSETIKVSNLNKCEYEVVEVLDENEDHIEVMMFERVHGFSSVFKATVKGGSDVKITIPRSELLRFSHFIPAFRLTGERDGALRGCVELDPTALSRNLRRS